MLGSYPMHGARDGTSGPWASKPIALYRRLLGWSSFSGGACSVISIDALASAPSAAATPVRGGDGLL
jgi:hypothetical protein